MVKSIDLLNILKNKLNKDEIIQSDLEEITDLTLRRYNLAGIENDIDLSELCLFKNLKTLVLSKFIINSQNIEYINENKNLYAVQFSGCDFESAIPIIQNVSYLIFDNCKNFYYELVNNNRTIKIIGQEIDVAKLNKIINTEKIYLQNCNIDNIEEILKLENLKELNLDGSSLNNTGVLKDLRKEIVFSNNKEYHPTGL